MQEVFTSKTRTDHLSRLRFDLSRIQQASRLPHGFFSPNWSSMIADGDFEEGNLILSKIPFKKTTSEFINGSYKDNLILGETISNNLNIQIAELENGITIVNHHGFWRPDPIGDADTIKAFAKVGQIVRGIQGPLVMCGDLNIIHDSPAMRQLDFLHDLTYEYHIETTLSGLKFDGKVACDHILTNDAVIVNSFAVLPDLVSDHLALTAEVVIHT